MSSRQRSPVEVKTVCVCPEACTHPCIDVSVLQIPEGLPGVRVRLLKSSFKTKLKCVLFSRSKILKSSCCEDVFFKPGFPMAFFFLILADKEFNVDKLPIPLPRPHFLSSRRVHVP